MEVTFIEGTEACIQQQHDIRFGKKKVKIIKSSVCYLFFYFKLHKLTKSVQLVNTFIYTGHLIKFSFCRNIDNNYERIN